MSKKRVLFQKIIKLKISKNQNFKKSQNFQNPKFSKNSQIYHKILNFPQNFQKKSENIPRKISKKSKFSKNQIFRNFFKNPTKSLNLQKKSIKYKDLQKKLKNFKKIIQMP